MSESWHALRASAAASWVKQVDLAGNFNFPTDH